MLGVLLAGKALKKSFLALKFNNSYPFCWPIWVTLRRIWYSLRTVTDTAMETRFSFIVFLLAGFLVSGCHSEPSVYFESPQPQAIAGKKYISESLRGNYVSTKDSSILKVTAQELLRFNFSILDLAFAQLKQDSVPYRIQGDYFFLPEAKQEYRVLRQTPDSVFLAYYFVDTLFSAQNQNQVRQFKGGHVFNTQKEKNRWEVFYLRPGKKKSLTLRVVSDSLDVAKLNALQVLEKREDRWVANPSRQQFRKFLKDGGFSDAETFLKHRGRPLHLETELFNLTRLLPGRKEHPPEF